MFPVYRNEKQNQEINNLKSDFQELRKQYKDEEIKNQIELLGYNTNDFTHLFTSDSELRMILEISDQEYTKIFSNYRWRR